MAAPSLSQPPKRKARRGLADIGGVHIGIIIRGGDIGIMEKNMATTFWGFRV